MLVSVTGTLSRKHFLRFFGPRLWIDIAGRSATTGLPEKGGSGHNGGVWEWTSSVFDSYEGFEPSKLYPGWVIPSPRSLANANAGQ